MPDNSAVRRASIGVVWSVSAAAAVWLAWGSGNGSMAPGQVVAQEYRIAPLETGRLATVMVAPGQRVAGGQEIARLDTAVLEREIAVAEARLRYYGTETDASAAALESEVFQAERSFQADAAEAKTELENARASREHQAAELRQLRAELRQQQQYLSDGLIRRDRVDQLALQVKSLEAAQAEWPRRIEVLESKFQATAGRLAHWQGRHSGAGDRMPDQLRVRPYRQRALEQIEALRVLRARLDQAGVIAPADGVVISVTARPGDVVRTGEPLAVLNGIGLRQVVAYVPERDSRQLRAGDRAIVRRRNHLRERHPSTVVSVAAAVTPLPARFWIAPQIAAWGREVVLESPAARQMDAGEALDVIFQDGGR